MHQAMGWLLASLLLSLLLVRAAITYAHRRGMYDQPGRRRSHQVPTARGGGIGIVLAMLICLPGTLSWTSPAWPTSLIAGLWGGLLLVALAGWWDDHRSLPVLPRLAAQLLAVGGFSVCLLWDGAGWWWLPLLLVGGTWSINLHNFMDGIDGLLAQQAIFVGAGLAWLAWSAQVPGLSLAAGALAAAAAGFWCYNRPSARIFMGDVGSGSVGLLIFAFTTMLWQRDHDLLWPALILSSAFITDASLTLLVRVWRGRRWYTAHREHLYQWLVRKGESHARVDAAWMGWNLVVAAPSAWLAWSHLPSGFAIMMAVYAGAAIVWTAWKRRCLRRQFPGAH